VSIRLVGDLVFTLVLLTIIVAAMVAALDWPYSARLAPLAVGVPAALLCLMLALRGAWRVMTGAAPEENRRVMDLRADRTIDPRVFAVRASLMFAWIFGFAAAIWLVGFVPSVPVFVFLYMLLQAKEKWWSALLYGAGMFAFMVLVFHVILHVAWMRGQFPWLQRLILSYLNQLV
jgi:hypothetical protein